MIVQGRGGTSHRAPFASCWVVEHAGKAIVEIGDHARIISAFVGKAIYVVRIASKWQSVQKNCQIVFL